LYWDIQNGGFEWIQICKRSTIPSDFPPSSCEHSRVFFSIASDHYHYHYHNHPSSRSQAAQLLGSLAQPTVPFTMMQKTAPVLLLVLLSLILLPFSTCSDSSSSPATLLHDFVHRFLKQDVLPAGYSNDLSHCLEAAYKKELTEDDTVGCDPTTYEWVFAELLPDTPPARCANYNMNDLDPAAENDDYIEPCIWWHLVYGDFVTSVNPSASPTDKVPLTSTPSGKKASFKLQCVRVLKYYSVLRSLCLHLFPLYHHTTIPTYRHTMIIYHSLVQYSHIIPTFCNAFLSCDDVTTTASPTTTALIILLLLLHCLFQQNPPLLPPLLTLPSRPRPHQLHQPHHPRAPPPIWLPNRVAPYPILS
jgi:hypothetical protein